MTQIILFLMISNFSGAAATEAPSEKARPSITSIESAVRKNADLEFKSSKGQKLASLHIQETKDGLTFLFETKELGKKTFRLSLEPNCSAGKKSGVVLREQEIRYDSFSDEFKMKGYSFEGEGEQSLKGKAVKLFQLDKKSKLTELSCSEIGA